MQKLPKVFFDSNKAQNIPVAYKNASHLNKKLAIVKTSGFTLLATGLQRIPGDVCCFSHTFKSRLIN